MLYTCICSVRHCNEFCQPRGVSLSLFTLQSTLWVYYRDALSLMPASPLRVRAMMNRMSRSRRPSLWETTTTTWGPSFNWGARFPAFFFFSRWESPTRVHTQKRYEKGKTKWWVVKRKEKEYYIYLGMTIGPSPGAARWWTVLLLPTQPWPGAIVFFSQPKRGKNRKKKKTFMKSKEKNKRDERLSSQASAGWCVQSRAASPFRLTLHDGRLRLHRPCKTKETDANADDDRWAIFNKKGLSSAFRDSEMPGIVFTGEWARDLFILGPK